MISLQNLSQKTYPQQHILAVRENDSIEWQQWLADLERTAQLFEHYKDSKVALFHSDGYTFTVQLFALWLNAAIPILLPNNTPGTLHSAQQLALATLDNAPLAKTDKTKKAATNILSLPNKSRLQLFTSGSTGNPKLIDKTLFQLDAELEQLKCLWPKLNEAKTFAATVSHQHIYGLLFKLLLPLCSSRAFFTDDLQTAQQVFALADREQAVAWIASPAHLKRLNNVLQLRKSPQGLTTIVSSGGQLALEDALAIGKWSGCTPIEIFGSTETGGVAYRTQTQFDETPWKPFPNVQVKLNETKALLVLSPQAEAPIWAEMGDQAHILTEGSFLLRGRSDRLVKIEEKRLSLDEMDQQLTANPWVKEARTVVLPGKRTVIGAVIALNHKGREAYDSLGKSTISKKIRSDLAVHFERVTLPRKWRFTDTLPTDQQGKIHAKKILALFETPGELASEQKTLPSEVKVIHQSATNAELEFTVDLDLAFFQGHFDSSPILPGVVQTLWALKLAERYTAFEGPVVKMRKLKFKNLIRPTDRVTLLVDCASKSSELNYRFISNDLECSSGCLINE